MFRRKKSKEEPKKDEKKKNLERDRLQKAEEAYLERLAGSIRDGNFYVKRPKPSDVQPDPDSRGFSSAPPLAPPPPPVPPRAGASPTPPRAGSPYARQSGAVAPDPPSATFAGLEDVPEETLKKVLKPAPQPDPPTMPSPMPPVSFREAVPEGEAKPEARVRPSTDTMGAFPKGTILQLGDGTIAVYCSPVKAKGYEVVYMLRMSGKVQPEGIALYAYEAKKIGSIPEEIFEEMRKTLRWDRDTVCFHLDKYKYCDLIPQIERRVEVVGPEGAKTAAPMPDPPTAPLIDPARELVKGRRVFISFGPGKTWEAIYWGKDLLGHIVAHKTHNDWALMHLDIKRFRDSIEVGEILKPEDIQAIQQAILSTQERYDG